MEKINKYKCNDRFVKGNDWLELCALCRCNRSIHKFKR
jgi:hypothetical protein